MKQYVADFETTTNEDDCHVWAWAACDIENVENVIIGTSIDEFMDWCKSQPDNPVVSFHNLKWDSQFILYWLFHNSFKHVTSKERASNTFTTVINSKGLFYKIEVIFYLKGKKVKKVTFQDSYKLLPMSAEKVAETLKLPVQKLKIDYDAHNNLPIGTPLTDEEIKYITHDVQIIGYALNYFHKMGLNRLTIGSCALFEYKNIIGKNTFRRWFPSSTSYHKNVKDVYKGGYVYVNPKYKGRTVKNGIVLDKNSMFPWIMDTKVLPHGTPIFFRGQYQQDNLYPLYIQQIRCTFELKKGHLPTIQIKSGLYYSGTEYLTSSNDEERVLCLTNMELELFFKHYKTNNVEYISGWKFQGSSGLFKEYISKWNGNKEKARQEENYGLALVSKAFLNHLYGKFGTDITLKSRVPFLGEDDIVHYRTVSEGEKDGIYIPLAIFVTSYSRVEMVTAAQTIMDDYRTGKSKIDFCYCDTDSLHCVSPDFALPEGLEINKTKLGAWKFESKFTKAIWLRSKCYIELSKEDVYDKDPTKDYELKVTVAGMPDGCKEQVTFKNFDYGATYTGKKQPVAVKGGVVLQSIDFTIKK